MSAVKRRATIFLRVFHFDIEIIENKIYFIRDKKVMLDSDLANLYDIETKVLNQSVKRNMERFPEEFMFQLTDEEHELLRSQIVTSKESKGGRRYNPYVFTEHGILMLSNVVNSKRAIAVSIQIIKTFNRLRQILITHEELKQKIEEMESKYDKQFIVVFQALRQLLSAPDEPHKEVGFRTK